MPESNKPTVKRELLEQRIFTLRGLRVMIDADLAEVYGTSTKKLNQAVKRNIERFPIDFMFPLKPEEKNELVAKCDHLAHLKYSRYLPYAFTEHGALMAANILNNPQAVEMSVFVVRAFVRMRNVLIENKEMARKLAELEQKVDAQFKIVFTEIKKLMAVKERPKQKIGFVAGESENTEK